MRTPPIQPCCTGITANFIFFFGPRGKNHPSSPPTFRIPRLGPSRSPGSPFWSTSPFKAHLFRLLRHAPRLKLAPSEQFRFPRAITPCDRKKKRKKNKNPRGSAQALGGGAQPLAGSPAAAAGAILQAAPAGGGGGGGPALLRLPPGEGGGGLLGGAVGAIGKRGVHRERGSARWRPGAAPQDGRGGTERRASPRRLCHGGSAPEPCPLRGASSPAPRRRRRRKKGRGCPPLTHTHTHPARGAP